MSLPSDRYRCSVCRKIFLHTDRHYHTNHVPEFNITASMLDYGLARDSSGRVYNPLTGEYLDKIEGLPTHRDPDA